MKDIQEQIKRIFKEYLAADKRGICLQLIKLNYKKYQEMNILNELRYLYYLKYKVIL